jgi:hypothetical protein
VDQRHGLPTCGARTVFALLGHISKIEKAFAVTSTTRNWNTVTKLASLSS